MVVIVHEDTTPHANAVGISELHRALDAGQVDVAVHWLQLLLMSPSGESQTKSSRMKRLRTLQRAANQMIGDAGNDDEGEKLALRPGLAPRDAGSSCELSYSQLQMFALQRLQPKSTAYNVVRALQLTDVRFDEMALQHTCDALMAKHEALRTCFDVDTGSGGQPQQYLYPRTYFQDHSFVRVVQSDLVQEGSNKLAEFVASVIGEPFDLARQAPMRVYAFVSSLTSAPWVLSVVLHHIVTDAASSQLFWDDFLTLYARFSRFRANKSSEQLVRQIEIASSNDTRLTYGDFAVWQRAQMRSGIMASSLQYWTNQLTSNGVPPLLELPFDRSRRNGKTSAESTTRKGDVVVFRSSASLQKAFSALCHAQGASVFMGLLAVFYLLVERLSHQQDFVIGVPSSGRTRTELEQIMGYFVNTLPLRLGARFNENNSFQSFLVDVRETVLGAYSHMDIPFHKVLEHLRATARHSDAHGGFEKRWQLPLFQVMFSWEQSDKTDHGGYTEFVLPHQSAKFDLMLSMRYRDLNPGTVNAERVLEGSMEYPSDYFARSTVERFSRYYLHLLEQVTQAPTKVLRLLYMLPDSEQQLICSWGTPVTLSLDESMRSPSALLHECLNDQVMKTPLNTALHFEEITWTYRRLWNHSDRVAQALLQTTRNDENFHVGLLLDRGLENVAAMVGTLRANATFVPLDTEFPRERLRYMVHDSSLQVIITERKYAVTAAELVAPSDRASNDLETLILFYEDLMEAVSSGSISTTSSNKQRPSSVAYILYTSGSTGNPKGVVVPHSALMTTLWWTVRTYNVTCRDVFLQSTSTTLDGSLSQLFSALLVGGSARITRPNGLHDLHYMETVLLQGPPITFCVFVPSYFSLIVDFLCGRGHSFPSHVKHVILAGEAFPFELARQFYWKHPESRTCLVNEYGPTEASITSTAFRVPRELALQTDSEMNELQSVPIGKPIDDHSVLVLDVQRRLVPVNVPGELYIGGVGVATGYWGRPDLTIKSFIHHEDLPESLQLIELPYRTGRRWYKTGDLVKWLPSGDLVFLGRTDAQVKHHGMRIELQEVRNVLLRHGLVKAAEVLLVPQQSCYGQKQQQSSSMLVAFVMLTDSGNAQLIEKDPLNELRTHLCEHLPRHMVPQKLQVVDRWPRTPNGKIDLCALAASTNVDAKHSLCGDTSNDGSNITEQLTTDILRQVWMQALGLEMLDADDNLRFEEKLMSQSFFELGGDSLAAIRAIALAQARGLSLALDQFFCASSLPEMARSAAVSMLDVREFNSQTLLPLNCPTEAKRPTLFLFHDADGTVWKLLELARQLPFNVIGIQAPIDEFFEPSSVEELAKVYWSIIRKKQNAGPYSFGGFSFGCRVAYEVARLAVRDGHELLPLLLLDGLPFELPLIGDETLLAKRELTRDQVEEYATEAFGDENSPLWQLGVNYRKFCAMEDKYQPHSIAEFETASCLEPPISLHADLYMTERWSPDVSRFGAVGINVTIVATVPNCTHLTMLRQPNVEQIARRIRERASGVA